MMSINPYREHATHTRSACQRGGRFVGVALLAALVLSGCGTSEPQFRMNLLVAAKNDLTVEQKEQVADILAAMFGTPDDPFALPETGLDAGRLQVAAGGVSSDRTGRAVGLYREHCVHCHGVTGDGAGPTAAFLNPYPRDFREGKYKWKRTQRPAKPTDEDLMLVLHNGVPGTAMPSFQLLPPYQQLALLEYVKYLSIRGEFEIALMRYVYNEVDAGADVPNSRQVLVDELLMPIVGQWQQADDRVVAVARDPAEPTREQAQAIGQFFFGPAPTDWSDDAKLAQLRALFGEAATADRPRDQALLMHRQLAGVANCFSCHGVTALGDGQATDYDDWSKVVFEAETEIAVLRDQLAGRGKDGEGAPKMSDEQREQARQRMAALEQGILLPPRNAQPRNLRMGVYRGGRRPVDLFWRLHEGINGTPMPAVPQMVSAVEADGLSEEQKQQLHAQRIWYLIDYVKSLPYGLDGQLGADYAERAETAAVRERL